MATSATMKIYDGSEWVELNFGPSTYLTRATYASSITTADTIRASKLSLIGPDSSGTSTTLSTLSISGSIRRLVNNYWGTTTVPAMSGIGFILVKIVGYGDRVTYHYIPNFFALSTSTAIVLQGPYSTYTATVTFVIGSTASTSCTIVTARSNSTYVTGIYIYAVQ